MNFTNTIAIALITALATCSNVSAQITNPVRQIQIRTIDFDNQTIEIRNFGTTDQALDGWRFCTHDESVVRRYSSSTGLNGVTLAAGESMFLMYNNDASPSATNEFNISSLGNFATPLDVEGAYGIQFYINSSFGNGNNISDHLQFSLNGADNTTADERSDEAVSGNLWTDENLWISVSEATTSISLLAGAETSETHSPTDYVVSEITNPVRQVQIRTIDIENQTIEIRNFGTTDQALDGWRFCTHDESAVRRYSSGAGLNGMVLAAGESMFLMYNNDASPSATNEFNISSLGNFATPLDVEGAYGIQFYINSSFGNGNNIADHLQFSLNGTDNTTADERSDEAVSGNLWTDENLWISVSDSTTSISLLAGAETSETHSPSDYEVVDAPPALIGDFDGDGDVDADDIDAYRGNIGQSAMGELAPLNLDQDEMITLADHNLLVTQHVQTSNNLTGTILGDANLDGTINVLGDALALVSSLGSDGNASWSDGDFNADGNVDVLNDAFILVGNLGTNNSP